MQTTGQRLAVTQYGSSSTVCGAVGSLFRGCNIINRQIPPDRGVRRIIPSLDLLFPGCNTKLSFPRYLFPSVNMVRGAAKMVIRLNRRWLKDQYHPFRHIKKANVQGGEFPGSKLRSNRTGVTMIRGPCLRR